MMPRPMLFAILLCAPIVLTAQSGVVRTGIDVLEGEKFTRLLRGATPERPRRIGLLTNQTGLDRQGRRTIDVINNLPGLKLAAIFSPEHGIAGKTDKTEIEEQRDAGTGIAVQSLYGDTDQKRRPSEAALKDLDAVVIDLQDAGVRFYSYESTMAYFLEAVAKAGIEIYLLDRPNPINGVSVQGPMSEEAESFANPHPLPVRHGMTLAELAQLFNETKGIFAKLTVVPMQGWQRSQWFDATGVPWVNPSPNLRSVTEAALYPGVALVEQTNVSVGRGTDTPFEVVGAPWISGEELSAYLSRRKISGVTFTKTAFTPSSEIFAGKMCQGVKIELTDRAAL